MQGQCGPAVHAPFSLQTQISNSLNILALANCSSLSCAKLLSAAAVLAAQKAAVSTGFVPGMGSDSTELVLLAMVVCLYAWSYC